MSSIATTPDSHRNTGYGLILPGVLIVIIALLVILGPLVLPYDIAAGSIRDRLLPPGTELRNGSIAWLGTDGQGRDILTLIMHGLRTSVLVAASATLVSGIVGVTLGVLAGYAGGWIDAVISRCVEIFLIFPAILLAIVIAGLLGPSLVNLVIILAVTRWVVFARLARASTLTFRERDWVRGARVLGVSNIRIIVVHILPFLIGPLATAATLEFAAFVMTEASLSFLGIGLPASTISLGKTIAEGRDFMSQAWWISTMPGLVLVTIIVVIGLIGDHLSSRYGGR